VPLPVPEPGLIISYGYLWHSEHQEGQEEGVKGRPCAIILTMQAASGETIVTVLPITHSAPGEGSEQRTGCEPPEGRHFQRLAPTAQCRVIRHRESEAEQSDDGADEPFGLPQCQTEDRAHRQRRGDRQGRIMGLPAGRRSRFGPPRRDGLVGEPDGQAAAAP